MWGKILNILKMGGVLVGSIGILFGAFRFIEQGNRSAEQVKEVNTTINTRFDNMDIRLNKIDNNITDLQEKAENQYHSISTLQKSYIEYVRKNTQNTDDLYNTLKDFIDTEKKSIDKPTVYVTPINMTRYNSILLSKK